MDPLSLSDSDSDALFDTPAPTKGKSKGQNGEATVGATAGKARGKESHYTTEEAREAALRRELQSVRNVNKVIEGVVESLEKARNNMDVRIQFLEVPFAIEAKSEPDCVAHCEQCVNITADVDAHPVPDGAQSTPHTEPAVSGCQPGSHRHRKRGDTTTAGSPAA